MANHFEGPRPNFSSAPQAPTRRLNGADRALVTTHKWSKISKLKLEDHVSLADARACVLQGIVAYVGEVHFDEGVWVGIQLTGPSVGKGYNDGSINGKRYFGCVGKSNGVFSHISEIQRRIENNTGNADHDRIQKMKRTTKAMLAELRYLDTLKKERESTLLQEAQVKKRSQIIKSSKDEIYIQRLKRKSLQELRGSREEGLPDEQDVQGLAGPKLKFGSTDSLLCDSDFEFMKGLQDAQQNFVLTDPTLPDNPVTFASQAFLNMTRYNHSELLGRNCRFLQGPLTSQKSVARVRLAIEEGSDCSLCLLNYRRDGDTFFNEFFITALRDKRGRVKNYIGVQCEISRELAASRHKDVASFLKSKGGMLSPVPKRVEELAQDEFDEEASAVSELVSERPRATERAERSRSQSHNREMPTYFQTPQPQRKYMEREMRQAPSSMPERHRGGDYHQQGHHSHHSGDAYGFPHMPHFDMGGDPRRMQDHHFYQNPHVQHPHVQHPQGQFLQNRNHPRTQQEQWHRQQQQQQQPSDQSVRSDTSSAYDFRGLDSTNPKFDPRDGAATPEFSRRDFVNQPSPRHSSRRSSSTGKRGSSSSRKSKASAARSQSPSWNNRDFGYPNPAAPDRHNTATPSDWSEASSAIFPGFDESTMYQSNNHHNMMHPPSNYLPERSFSPPPAMTESSGSPPPGSALSEFEGSTGGGYENLLPSALTAANYKMYAGADLTQLEVGWAGFDESKGSSDKKKKKSKKKKKKKSSKKERVSAREV